MNRRVDIVILGHALAEAPVAQTAPQLENKTTTGAAKPSRPRYSSDGCDGALQ